MKAEPWLQQAVDALPDSVQKVGHKAAHRMHDLVLEGGELTRTGADVLHGTWLGHPLHPVLTDITIGSMMLGGLFDLWGEIMDDDRARWTGDQLLKISVIAAVPTALTGLADYSAVPKPATKTAVAHGVLNTAVLGLNIGSWVSRRRHPIWRGYLSRRTRRPWPALGMSFAAQLIGVASAWLGGSLVYRHKVGVDRAERFEEPRQWRAVLEDAQLPERTPRRVEVDGKGVLLYREDGRIYAIGAVCNHAGGPLEEGKFSGGCVECPLHNSVYDLRDGRNVHGPATREQPAFRTRVRDGRIEICLLGAREVVKRGKSPAREVVGVR